jgi:hypothetical protein
MHSALLPALVAARRHTCPCGAHNDEPHGLCRKCLTRIAWRRHHRHRSRYRRRSTRLARQAIRLLGRALLLPQPHTGGDR